ncbi:hypothetical protein D3C79_912310 [compost metagenome]
MKLKASTEMQDSYGGAFLDKEGNLNINILGDNDKFKKNIELDSTVKYHSVKHSLKELQKNKPI